MCDSHGGVRFAGAVARLECAHAVRAELASLVVLEAAEFASTYGARSRAVSVCQHIRDTNHLKFRDRVRSGRSVVQAAVADVLIDLIDCKFECIDAGFDVCDFDFHLGFSREFLMGSQGFPIKNSLVILVVQSG